MKVLHSAALLRPPSGIINQMRWEQQAAEDLGLDWKAKIFCPQGYTKSESILQESQQVTTQPTTVFTKAHNWYKLRKEYYKWLKSQEDVTDLFLLRYYVHDPFQYQFISNCSKPVYLIFHTLEVPELALDGTLSGLFRSNLEKIIGPWSIQKSSGIIGVTSEIIEHQKKRSRQENKTTLIYPNGIIFSDTPIKDARGKIPQLLFVAGNFVPWHGLDLILSSMLENSEDFTLHLVGDLSSDLKRRAQNDSRIILHGKRQADEIKNIASQCHIGLSSFALHRKHMKEACTLKVREYLMMGLPVCAGHDDVFDTDFPYFVNEQPDISRILQYANNMALTTRQQVADSAKPYIEKTELLDQLYRSLTI